MKATANRGYIYSLLLIIAGGLVLASCATSPPPCNSPQSKNLTSAISAVQSNLSNGCAEHFDRYYDDLLSIAEGDPKAENKRVFSEFLVWASDEGLLSQGILQPLLQREICLTKK